MILPTNEECVRICNILCDETDASELTEWEYDFVTSCKDRKTFSDRQKEVFYKLSEKYDCD